MKKTVTRFCVLLLVTALIISGSAATASANTDSGTAALSLAVYLTDNGQTKLIHDYSVNEMKDLSDGSNIMYSSIDAMPARVLTIGTGVYMSTLLSNLKKYTDADTLDFAKIKLTATDGWQRTYTKSELFKARYYYKDLFSTDSWDAATGTADLTVADNSLEVKPMLAVSSWQGRVMKSEKNISENIGNMSGDTMFRFCLGMTPGDLTSKSSTTSEYGKWIDKIEIIIGDTADGNAENWRNRFKDVAENDWFYQAVKFADSSNLFQGTGADTFSPNLKMTRGMFVTVLGKLAKADVSTYQNNFDDVSTGQYYEGYVAWASGEGIVSGYSAGSFGPNDTVTREQLALMMYRYAKQANLNVSNTDNAKCRNYSDYGTVMSAANEAMCWAVNNGLIAGNNGKLMPKGDASRAQVAQIMMNFKAVKELI